MWWEECCFLFSFPSNSVHFHCSKTKLYFLSYFSVFSVSIVFLNYGFYLHYWVLFSLHVASEGKCQMIALFSASYVETMSFALEHCITVSLKLIHSKQFCYIYKTAGQSFCPRLYTLLKMLIGLLMCRISQLFPPRLLIFKKGHAFETGEIVRLSWWEKEISKIFEIL